MGRIKEVSSTDATLTSHAESSFDPDLYVSLYYSGEYSCEEEKNSTTWSFDKLHDIFKEGKIKGKELLDIGTGPVVYPIITASKWFDEVYLSDFSKENIQLLEKWMRGESNHMKTLMEYFAQKEGNLTWEEKNQQVLKKVKAAVECDVNKHNPLSDTALENKTFDVITSCLCLSVAVMNMEEFKKALQNIGKLLNPGGRLIVSDMTNNTFYAVGDMKLRAFASSSDDIQNAYKESGYQIEFWETFSFQLDSPICDGDTVYTVVAKKL